jgi:hypothetical protein
MLTCKSDIPSKISHSTHPPTLRVPWLPVAYSSFTIWATEINASSQLFQFTANMEVPFTDFTFSLVKHPFQPVAENRQMVLYFDRLAVYSNRERPREIDAVGSCCWITGCFAAL